MQRFDNFLPESHLKEIQRVFLGNDFPWYYASYTSKPQTGIYGAGTVFTTDVIENPQFVHTFYYGADQKTSALYDLVSPFVVLLQKESKQNLILKRIKANMVLRQADYPDGCYNTPHVDWNPDDRVDGKYKSFLYYVTESDGDTFIFNEHIQDKPKYLTVKQRITPKVNSGVLFDSDNYHASSPPVKSNIRVVINLVFMEGQ